MNSIFITGCNRGLGLGLIKNLMVVPTPPTHVFATCRNLQKAEVNINLNNLFIYQVLVPSLIFNKLLTFFSVKKCNKNNFFPNKNKTQKFCKSSLLRRTREYKFVKCFAMILNIYTGLFALKMFQTFNYSEGKYLSEQ